MGNDRSDMYAPSSIEGKWQAIWEERGTNRFTPDAFKNAPEPFYNLMMFPYPSAEGLHVGNIYAFTGADVHGRFQRLKGKNVFEPIGFDANAGSPFVFSVVPTISSEVALPIPESSTVPRG